MRSCRQTPNQGIIHMTDMHIHHIPGIPGHGTHSRMPRCSEVQACMHCKLLLRIAKALPLLQQSQSHMCGCSCSLWLLRTVVCRCGLSHVLQDEDVVQIVKRKVTTGGEDGKGRFKTKSDKPLKISDREKKPALKT